jgi:LPXTG-site transpeptidase (sortase) family protein
MAFRLRAARRVDSRLAGEGPRRVPAALFFIGGTALVSGIAVLLINLAPYFTIPSATSRILPLSALAVPLGDPSIVVAPLNRAVVVPAVTAAPIASPVDGVWFEMRVPAVGYSAVVRQGVGINVLNEGPGHYPSTPWPGQPGNVGIAGHNTFWLAFSRLKPGQRVDIQTQHGSYVYEITGSKVVSPDDRSVLAGTSDNRLTLTTCYPLWAGVLATKRLIFSAREIGGVT